MCVCVDTVCERQSVSMSLVSQGVSTVKVVQRIVDDALTVPSDRVVAHVRGHWVGARAKFALAGVGSACREMRKGCIAAPSSRY